MDDLQTDSALVLSLSEISALTMRATRGSGRSWGEAEEAAEATCWLARAGLDWAGALLEALRVADAGPDCALRTGIALADEATLSGPPNARRTVNSACFLLPFAARISDQSGQRISLCAADMQVVLSPDACPLITGPVRVKGPVLVTLAPDHRDPSPCPDWPQTHRGTVLATQYARLMELMMAFTVPTSAHSQAGAGSQGNDND